MMLKSLMKKLKEYGFFTYGRVIPGLMIYGKPAPYPVVNERATRAGAGIMFVIAFFSFMQAFFVGEYMYLGYTVLFFFFDFLMKVIVGLKFSPVGFIANMVVRTQEPEFVGAIQKRFAWSIGLVLSSTMVLLMWVFEVRGPINLSICLLCLSFMFLETSFGICVGCKIYNALLKKGVLKQPEYKPACPGNVCAIQ
jgi:hypothetical protein